MCFFNDNTIIYKLKFFFEIITFLRVYFNSFVHFKFIISVYILQFDNVIYNKIFILIMIALIKFSKNFKIKKKIKILIKVTSKNANNENEDNFNNNDYDFLFIDDILNIYRQ